MISDTNICSITGFPLYKINIIIDNIDDFYYEIKKAKKKYGKPQLDDDGNIKYRGLSPSVRELKRIQRKIVNFLQQIKLPEYVYGSVKNKNNIQNALAHVHNKHFFSVDLKNHFANINHHQVFKMFKENGFSESLSRTLTKLTTYKGSLPQGASTSPVISNLVFVTTGKKLLKILEGQNIKFTTFLDDFIFSSKTDFKSLHKLIIDTIKSGGFYINYEKIHYKKYRPEVTGIIIDKKILTLERKMRLRIIMNRNCDGYFKQLAFYNTTLSKGFQRESISSLF